MKRRLLTRIFAVGMAVMMLALAGCGGTDTSTSTTSTETTGKVIRMTTAFADPIDPACAMDSASCQVVVNLYDSLVYPDLDGTILNGVAADYSVSDDGMVYTFTLKDNVKFHDGSVMTAQDVVFSYERMVTIGQGYAYLFQNHVADVQAPDDQTVVITLTEPFAPFLSMLCRLYIVNEEQVMANLGSGNYGDMGDYGMTYLAQNDAGSGAYSCTSYTVNDRVVMTRFADYHGTFADNAPDAVEIINGTEAATVRTMMANGQLEISDQWQTHEAYEALGQLDGVKLGTYGAGQILYLMVNTKAAPLDDVHVRKALAYMIDYDQVCTSLFPGYLPVNNYVGDNLTGGDVSMEKYSYNMEKAKEELEASQYADQLLSGEMPITVAWVSEVPDEEKLALLLQASAAQLGVKVEISKVAWATQVQNTASVDSTPATSVCFMSPDYGEAGAMLYQRLHSDTAGTWQQTEWLQNTQLDGKIDTALKTMDDTARFALYDEIQSEALTEVYGIAVAEQGEQRAYADYIYFPAMEKGIASTTLGYNFLFKDFQVLDH
ncbi:MAG TPA: ABC transporter substrate-binding protein [Candidatus Evtepia faecigallinarum]|nr:ABC transporter substrate-binding protein [Candidatus Evtepia faecigallinarum]